MDATRQNSEAGTAPSASMNDHHVDAASAAWLQPQRMEAPFP